MSVKRKYIERVLMLTLVLAFLCISTGVGMAAAFGQQESGAAGTTAEPPSAVRWDLAMAIAVSIAIPCLAAGYAVGKVGAAALGAASEKPELLTRSLVFVALGEGLAIFGFLVALLLWLQF